jgi:hypothetical protein
MSDGSDIESCNEKTIIDKVNEQIDDIVNNPRLSFSKYIKAINRYEDLKKYMDIYAIGFLYIVRIFNIIVLYAFVYGIFAIIVSNKLEKNKNSLDTTLVIFTIYLNYIISTIDLYVKKITSIKKNLIVFKNFLKTHITIKNECIKELLEIFNNEMIDFDKEIQFLSILYKVISFDPPKCHPLLEDITPFKDDLKYAMDKDEKRNQVYIE